LLNLQVILSASESYFMQAEAAWRGWIEDDPRHYLKMALLHLLNI
jgi:hypothetical protein